jgi:predicted LPLAT superfamily acyltransferase
VHTGRNNYEVFVEPVADIISLPRKQREEYLLHWISLYALRLEKLCCRFPHHWFNFYDFWASSKLTTKGD